MMRPDRDAFDRLVHQHHAAVFRSALRVLRRADAAGDVVQDVFVRVLQGKVDLAAAASPRAVLCWLATQLAHNESRAGRRRRNHEESAAMQRSDDHAPLDRETATALRSGVAALPDDLRLPLLLRFEDDLTFAAIGSALSIGESTAHDRVQRALAALRQRLASLGVAVGAGDLEGWLAAAAPQAPPASLLPRLLRLGAVRPLLAAWAGKAALAAAAAAGLALAVVAGSSRDGPPPGGPALDTEAHALLADGTEEPVREPSPLLPAEVPGGAAQDPAPLPGVVRFSGTVRDATRAPAAGLAVRAVAGGGLKPFELATTTTDAAGAFVLPVPGDGQVQDLPLPRASVRKLRIVVQHHGRELWSSADLELRAAQPPLDIGLPRAAGLESERFSLTIAVRGPDGQPVAGVPVALQAAGDEPQPRVSYRSDAASDSDAHGWALLQSRWPGRQLLLVDGRKAGYAAHVETIEIAPGSMGRRDVTLAAGQTLPVQIGTVDGGLVPWANVWLEDEANGLTHWAKLGAGGGVTFEHLGAGPFTLRVEAHPYSPVRRPGLRPGREPVTVRVKAADDERDHGDHLAELHGRLLDATTGEPLAVAPFDVVVRRALPGVSTLPFDLVEPQLPVQQQRDAGELHERFHLVGLGAGDHVVLVHKSGYAPLAHPVTLDERELRTGLELRLLRPAAVHGTVRDAAGAPVAGALVTVLGVGEAADRAFDALRHPQRNAERVLPVTLACSVRTDASGRFELRSVPPFAELRVVAVTAAGAASSRSYALQPGERRAQDLQLGP